MTSAREESPVILLGGQRPVRRIRGARPVEPTTIVQPLVGRADPADHPDPPDEPPAETVDETVVAPPAAPVVDDIPLYGDGAPVFAAHLGRPIIDTPRGQRITRAWMSVRGCGRAALYSATHPGREFRPIIAGGRSVFTQLGHWRRGGEDGAAIGLITDPDKRAKEWLKEDRVKTRRRRATLLRVAGLTVILTAGILPTQVGVVLAALIGVGALLVVLAVFDIVGHHVLGPTPDELTRVDAPGPIFSDPTVPLTQHSETIKAALVGNGHRDVTVSEPYHWEADAGEYVMTVHSTVEISDSDITAVGIALGAPDNGVTTRRTGTIGYTQFRFRKIDVLAEPREITPVEFGSRSGRQPFTFGVTTGPTPLSLVLNGVHTAVVGMTRAGKTAVFELFLMFLTLFCNDVDVWAGDAQKAIVLRRWSRLLTRVAYTNEDILTMLKDVNAEIARRSEILGDAGADPDNPKSQWTPDMGRMIAVMIDELHVSTGKTGLEAQITKELAIGIRTGAEVDVNFLLFTQRLSSDDLGSTAIRSMIGTKIMLPMKEQDLQFLEITKDTQQQGWRPHLLKPALKAVGPRDAGKAYIESGAGHETPDLYKFDLPPDLVVLNRMVRDHADALGRPATVPRNRTEPVVGEVLDEAPGNAAADPEEGEVAPIVRWIRTVFDRAGDVDRLPTFDFVTHARADAEDPDSEFRFMCGRISAAKQPEKMFADIIAEQCSGWRRPARKIGGTGENRNQQGFYLEHLEHLERAAENVG